MALDASQPVADIGKQALVEIINRSLSAVDKATAFASQQIPEVVHELLVYKAVSSFLVMLLLIGLVFAYVKCCRIIIKGHPECVDDGSFIVVWLFGAAVVALPLLILFHNNPFDWIEIWLAPRVYLLQFAADLVKGK